MAVSDVGILVLGQDGKVESANDCARELLQADSSGELSDKAAALQGSLKRTSSDSHVPAEVYVNLPGLPALGVRSYTVAGDDRRGYVLLLQDARSMEAASHLLEQAARHRSFSYLSRDWVHDFKGILHVIRINHALLTRMIQRGREGADASIGSKSLEAIPREIERLDRSLELVLNARVGEHEGTFDVGLMCQRLVQLVSARAGRQRVNVVLELNGGSKEVVGFESQLQGAVLNLMVNGLEAMPETGRLVVTVDGGESVKVRVCDNGSGIEPELQDRLWEPHFVNEPRRTAIGLHVTRSIIEAHGGRIECKANAPQGTCFEIDLPAANSTGRIGNGSRTHRG